MKPPYAIGSVPSLSGHAVAYRWRSLPRVRRHRASKPQGSSERVLPWQITMDQLIFASLSHTHYWYEVGMLKVPAYPCVRLNPTVGSVLKGPCFPPGILGMRSNTPCKIVRYTDKCCRSRFINTDPDRHRSHLSASRRILIYLGENAGGRTKHTIQETRRAFSGRSRQPSKQILSVFLVVIMGYHYKIPALQKHYIYLLVYW